MSADWPRLTVAELEEQGTILVVDGNHGQYRPLPHEFGEGRYAYIRATDMDAGLVLFDAAARINDTAFRRIRKGVGAPGDVLFSHKGTVGKLALVPMDAPLYVCSPQTTLWRTLDEQKLDRRYLYCYMRSQEFIEQWFARKGETDMADYVSLTAQRELTVALPPLPEQQAIARVLGGLDDKIELNRRMNKTLEDLARGLFRSWFVDFDPVTKNGQGRAPATPAGLFPKRLVDSPIGPIPEGWRVGTLGDIGTNPRRGVQPTEIDPTTPYIGLEHMPRRCITLAEWGAAADVSSGKSRFQRGEILFGKLRPYFHKVGIALVDGVCSTDVIVAAPKKECWFGVLLGHLSSDEFIDFVDGASGGTRMPRTSWGDMSRYSVAIPPEPVANWYSQWSRQVAGMMRERVHESRSLAALRDALLPQLLSGEIRLREFERVVGNAAQEVLA